MLFQIILICICPFPFKSLRSMCCYLCISLRKALCQVDLPTWLTSLMWASIYLDLVNYLLNFKDGSRNIQSVNTGSLRACGCMLPSQQPSVEQPARWDDGGRASERLLMRQKNSDGAEVVWNDPEEGHIQRPPSGRHRSGCSRSPGKLHLVVERAVAGLHLCAVTLRTGTWSTSVRERFGKTWDWFQVSVGSLQGRPVWRSSTCPHASTCLMHFFFLWSLFLHFRQSHIIRNGKRVSAFGVCVCVLLMSSGCLHFKCSWSLYKQTTWHAVWAEVFLQTTVYCR